MDIIAHLTKKKVKFEHLTHPEKFTSQEVAAAQHVPGARMVKSVLVKADEDFVLAVLDANHRVDLPKLAKIVGARRAALADEKELERHFPDAEVGAEPPFGSLYNVYTVIDKHLSEEDEIVFQAGTHKDTIRMKWSDYEKLEKPKIAEFGVHI